MNCDKRHRLTLARVLLFNDVTGGEDLERSQLWGTEGTHLDVLPAPNLIQGVHSWMVPKVILGDHAIQIG